MRYIVVVRIYGGGTIRGRRGMLDRGERGGEKGKGRKTGGASWRRSAGASGGEGTRVAEEGEQGTRGNGIGGLGDGGGYE
jgi:hypothetical protein